MKDPTIRHVWEFATSEGPSLLTCATVKSKRVATRQAKKIMADADTKRAIGIVATAKLVGTPPIYRGIVHAPNGLE